MLRFFWAILDPLDKNERIYSDFYALFKPILAIIVGGLNRSDWVGMLRFQHPGRDGQFLSRVTGLHRGRMVGPAPLCQALVRQHAV